MFTKGFLGKLLATSVLAGGLLLVAGPTKSLADRDWTNDCHQRLENVRLKLDSDIKRHGENSPQADRDRDRLEDARKWCRDHHADWDHSVFDIQLYLHR